MSCCFCFFFNLYNNSQFSVCLWMGLFVWASSLKRQVASGPGHVAKTQWVTEAWSN